MKAVIALAVLIFTQSHALADEIPDEWRALILETKVDECRTDIANLNSYYAGKNTTRPLSELKAEVELCKIELEKLVYEAKWVN